MRIDQDSKNNNFNLLRFIAASTVLYQHCYPLFGVGEDSYFANIINAVEVFFIISGFLITKSWVRSQRYGSQMINYLKNRFLRIVPGLFVCLLLTILIIGPISTNLSLGEYFSRDETYQYLLKNIAFNTQYNLPGVFEYNPYKDAVNGSLWTLPIEVFCYIGVAVFGLIKILQKKHILLCLTLLTIIHFFYLKSNPDSIFLQNLSSFLKRESSLKCVIYFLIGALFFLYSDKIYFNKFIAILAGLIYLFFPTNDYVTFLLLPYLVFYLAFFIKFKDDFLKDFGNKYDLSYGIYIYAFPVQQTIMHFFNSEITLPIFFLSAYLITIILAYYSFVMVEKPCLNLKISRKKQLKSEDLVINMNEKSIL